MQFSPHLLWEAHFNSMRETHQKMIEVHIFRAAKCCSHACYDACTSDESFMASSVSEKMMRKEQVMYRCTDQRVA